MGYSHVKIASKRLINSVVNAAEDTALNATQRTDAYRKANLGSQEVEIQDFTNGIFIDVTCGADAETGTLELWGYPLSGDAEYLGTYTYTADAMVASDGGFYVDAFVEATEGQHTVTISNQTDGKAVLKMDSLGFAHIVGLVTAITGAAGSVHKVYMRPW